MTQEDTIERDEVARKNAAALSLLVRDHSLFISHRDFDRWRPTVATSGMIDGFYDLGTLTCVATDGLQAWFLREAGERPWFGHVQFFKWDVPVVRMVPYTRADGSQGMFKSVKEQGAPSALYGRTPKVRAHRETASKKKKEKTKRQQLLDLI